MSKDYRDNYSNATRNLFGGVIPTNFYAKVTNIGYLYGGNRMKITEEPMLNAIETLKNLNFLDGCCWRNTRLSSVIRKGKPHQIVTCLSLILLCFFQGCVIEEAPVDHSRSLSVVADYFTGSDSMLLKRFARINKVKVRWANLNSERLLKRMDQEPFNVGVDVILTHNTDLRIALMRKKWLKGIERPDWMDQMEGQFKKKFWYWLPLSHDPLLVTAPADTSGLCFPINFRVWHKDKDTLPPMVRVVKYQKEYQEQLERSVYLKWLNLVKPRGYWSSERLYSLTGIIEKLTHKDSTFNKNLHACKTFLKTEKDQYITRTYCAGIYRNGENVAEAQKFIRFYSDYMYRVAAERNELPVRTDIPVGRQVRRAGVR